MALTWSDLYQYIAEWAQREGGKPNAGLYLSLANQALAIMSEESGLFRVVLTNAGGGALTLTGNTVELPETLVKVLQVEYDDAVVQEYETGWQGLDQDEPGWRDSTGQPAYWMRDGQGIILSSTPEGVTTGLLTVRGVGYLPTLAAVEGDDTVNPLASLSRTHQMLPAYYALSELPADPEKKAEVIRQARFEKRWLDGKDSFLSWAQSRTDTPFTF